MDEFDYKELDGKNNYCILCGLLLMSEINPKDNQYVTYLFDIEDYERISNIKWSIGTNLYLRNTNTNISLHRFIMNCPDDMVVDHINGNILDNRKSNLRICTPQQNGMNRKIPKNNSSKVKGVSWDKEYNKWRASIGYNHKTINLGRYDTKEEAIKVRKEAETKYFGEYNRKI